MDGTWTTWSKDGYKDSEGNWTDGKSGGSTMFNLEGEKTRRFRQKGRF